MRYDLWLVCLNISPHIIIHKCDIWKGKEISIVNYIYHPSPLICKIIDTTWYLMVNRQTFFIWHPSRIFLIVGVNSDTYRCLLMCVSRDLTFRKGSSCLFYSFLVSIVDRDKSTQETSIWHPLIFWVNRCQRVHFNYLIHYLR